jgi:hypothetical protein
MRYDRTVTFDTVGRNVSASFRALRSVLLLRSAERRYMKLSALNYARAAALRVTKIAVWNSSQGKAFLNRGLNIQICVIQKEENKREFVEDRTIELSEVLNIYMWTLNLEVHFIGIVSRW